MTILENKSLPASDLHPLVLLGAGHAHLVALKLWMQRGYQAPKGSMLVSPGSRAWYSGMMPGLIAGRFDAADCAIDLQPLCEATGLQLIESSVAAVSAAPRQVMLTSGQRLAYQVLSVNTGSQPPAPRSDGSIDMVPAKPFPVFYARWQAWLQNPPRRLVVLGGGAAAFELALALKKSLSGTDVLLVCAADLLSGYARGLQKRAQSLLQQRGIGLQQNIRVSSLASGFICDGERRVCEADALVLATGAAPLPWYGDSGLSINRQGFLRVTNALHSVDDPSVYVSGDACSLEGNQRSGVFAVRHGPILAHNLPAALSGTSLVDYVPQKQALALLATADGGALLGYGRFSAGSALARPLLGRWKDSLDLGFMRRHRLPA